jgi:5-formyltetrahydrofolate cyclo-ligase
LATVNAADLETASAQLCDRLRIQPIWHRATRILFFAPLPGELDLWPLLVEALHAGKTVGLPRYIPAQRSYAAIEIKDLAQDLAVGHFGIREPRSGDRIFPLNRLDLALVPGVGFDSSGHRLGRGKGYYDRLLAGIKGTKCGVAWDFQVLDAIPAELHDVCVDCILTPTRWLVAGQGWSGNDAVSK